MKPVEVIESEASPSGVITVGAGDGREALQELLELAGLELPDWPAGSPEPGVELLNDGSRGGTGPQELGCEWSENERRAPLGHDLDVTAGSERRS